MESFTSSDIMLNIAASLSGTTSAEGMEAMTLSMITGEDPAFDHQVKQLIDWMKNEEKPDVVHLSSTLLLGVAKALRQAMDIPIVCSLQDEEVWIDSLQQQYADIAWQRIAENIRFIDCFITPSQFYKSIVNQRIPQIKNIEVVYPGVDRTKYACADYPENQTIGFFYRMNQANGLDILAEAFVKLKKRNTIPHLQLKIGGGYTGKDKSFLRKIKKIVAPYSQDVEIEYNYNLDEHARFFRSITALSVPITFEEGVGLYLCEAFAAGRPAVEPATGSFPEIIGEAGITYTPNNSDALTDALEKLLANKDIYNRAKEKALELSATRYNEVVLAKQLITLYEHSVYNKPNETTLEAIKEAQTGTYAGMIDTSNIKAFRKSLEE